MPEHAKSSFLVVEGPDTGRVFTISQFPAHAGRLRSNEMVLSDEQVSRRHLRIEADDSGLVALDLRSRNGIFVNQRRVDRHVLSPGDQIRLGATVIVFSPTQDLLDKYGDISHPEFFPEEDGGPTSIRGFSEVRSAPRMDSFQTLAQASILLRSDLPPKDLVQQLLDILFEGFSPERAQMSWETQDKMVLARSRKEGKKCSPREVPEDLRGKAKDGPICASTSVTGTGQQRSEERTALVAPLYAQGEIRGWAYVDRSLDLPRYNPSDAVLLEPLSLIAGAVLERSQWIAQEKKLREQVQAMEKYVPVNVAKMISSKEVNIEEGALVGEEREVSILFSDIEGFTPLSEKLSPREITQLLNEYFQRMVDRIALHHGEVNKFIGDSIMALFGAPRSYGNDACNAVAAALDMVKGLQEFWKEIDEGKRFNIRVGINTGKVIAGNIGSEKRMEYTVVGDEVNVASRLEGISPSNAITIGARTAELVKHAYQLDPVSPVKVKGKEQPIQVYRVLGPLSTENL